VTANGREAEARAIIDAAKSAPLSAPASTSQAKTSRTATAAATSRSTTGAGCEVPTRTSESNQKLELREEQLHVDKQPVETGEVRLRKEVITEHRTIDVPVSREEVIVERHATAGKAAAGETISAGEEIRVPVREEQVHVSKDTVVKEEVSLRKQKVTDTKRVGEDVRREELRVDKQGKVDVRGDKR